MNLLSVADKLADHDLPPVTLDARRCVRANNRWSQCQVCVSACPVNALALDASITLNEKSCIACGLCLHVCPVGAFTGDDGAADLANSVARLSGASTLELVCQRHPAPEKGTAVDAIVLRAGKCLAASSPALFLRLLTQDGLKIIARLDACAECPLNRVQPEITRVLAAVGQLFPERVSAVVDKPDARARTRAVYDAKSPPVSRRDFFQWMTSESVGTAARAFLSETDAPSSSHAPPRERRRLLSALKQIALNDAAQSALVQGVGAIKLNASDDCTACGVCARACPTGALRFATTASDGFRLSCLVSACTDCGVCFDVCEPDALQRVGVPTIGELLATETQLLKAGKLKHCAKCNAQFAADIEGDLCQVCAFRQQNPFGTWKPRARSPRETPLRDHREIRKPPQTTEPR